MADNDILSTASELYSVRTNSSIENFQQQNRKTEFERASILLTNLSTQSMKKIEIVLKSIQKMQIGIIDQYTLDNKQAIIENVKKTNSLNLVNPEEANRNIGSTNSIP